MEKYLNLFGIGENSKVVKVAERDMEELEGVLFKYNGFKMLIRQFTTETELKPSEEIIEELFEEFEKAYSNYDRVFREVTEKYLKEEDLEKHILANFEICSLIIS